MIPTPGPELRIGAADELSRAFVAIVEDAATLAMAARQMFTLAIPGGSAVEVLCPPLAQASLAWKQVHVFWCDERAVSPADPASNVGLLRRIWSGTRALSECHLHAMQGDAPDLRVAADAYARELEYHCGEPPMLDLVLLGFGEDGHIASLFPGHDASNEKTRSAVETDSPKPPPRRITLTMPVLCRARTVVVTAFGAGKAAPIRDALTRTSDTPLARILGCAPSVHILLDHAAAMLLA